MGKKRHLLLQESSKHADFVFVFFYFYVFNLCCEIYGSTSFYVGRMEDQKKEGQTARSSSSISSGTISHTFGTGCLIVSVPKSSCADGQG